MIYLEKEFWTGDRLALLHDYVPLPELRRNHKTERSEEVGRNVLVGSIVRAKVAAGEIPTSELTEWLESRLTRDDDRQLFGLAKKVALTPPTVAADARNQKIAATTE